MKRKAEDRDLSRKMAAKDLERFFEKVPQGPRVGYGELLDIPDGSDLTVSFCIGTRGDLNRQEAKRAAKSWLEHIKRHPKARFVIHLAGYDDDPRDIWEIDEAARYVRRWARLAGLDDIDVAGARLDDRALAWLGACGAFGDEIKRQVILPPKTPKQ
jgi:hypothetical protein